MVTLQESCREAKSEATALRVENSRLRNEARDREKFWRALWQTRKTGQPPDPTDDSCLPSYAQGQSSPASSSSSGILSPSATGVTHLADSQFRYSGAQSNPLIPPSQPYMSSADYPQRSPALGYAPVPGPSAGQSDALSSPQSGAHGVYGMYVADKPSREDSWSPSGVCTGREYNPVDGSQSPVLVEASSASMPELSYNAQYSASIHSTTIEASYGSEQPLYMFSPSRSVSPALTAASTASSTSISVSSTSIAPSNYQFTFPEGTMMQDRPEFASFRRHFTLQGGTANVAVAGTVGDVLRHKLSTRPTPQHPSAPSPSNSRGEVPAYHEEEPYQSPTASHASARQRHNGTPESVPAPPVSRSPSPNAKISGTLAIIKAQAFGALRRTRGKTRTSSEGIAKAAVDALSAHGLGLGLVTGPPNKRQRLQQKDEDDSRV